ncbi:MAG: type III-A CRISPR-associated RAMP protein Csm5 [Microcystis flos-aquae TF09]|uniref:CRISPR system Cms protein Csm5 n=1 Tax=Microcystis flos-aquae TF09 TaxID=2060473 RepID=A0A3E0L630_9CHRO|nr:MAG: type III-A CRISPR-associated RAMP protein Csm5 [Microcystis flos-aquae TF09]
MSIVTAISKPEVYEIKTIKLTSPLIHIGSAVSRLNPFEYVQTTNKVYLPNQDALAKALKAKGGRYLEEYIEKIDNRHSIDNLLKQAFGDRWWQCQDPAGEAIFPNHAIAHKLTEERISDLRPMIRNGIGQFFIPGSSIKGAIRTAIAYYLIKHADRFQVPAVRRRSEIEQKLNARLGELGNKHKQKFLDDDLFMNSLFSEFTLTYQDRIFSAWGPNTDFLRSLKVSDSIPLVEKRITNKQGRSIPVNLPIVAEVIVSSRFPDYLAKYKASIYAEMVRNVSAEFTLTLDQKMLAWFKHDQDMIIPFSNLDELLKICEEFAQEQWDYEHDYWNLIKNNPRAAGKNLDFNYIRDIYEPKVCPYTLRIGWGSGMTGTTIGLCIDDQLRSNIRDKCGISAPGFEAPKSRRTIMNREGEIRYLPGWVKFK